MLQIMRRQKHHASVSKVVIESKIPVLRQSIYTYIASATKCSRTETFRVISNLIVQARMLKVKQRALCCFTIQF